MTDTCVVCGAPVPEGRMVCWICEHKYEHKEDDTEAVGFCRYEGNTYCLDAEGTIFLTGTILGDDGTEEPDFDWLAEFGGFTDESPNKKGVSKVQIRLELEANATAKVWLRFDSAGNWIQTGPELKASVKRSYYLPIIPRRGDHYRMKITGTGGARIYSIAREYYGGSELQKH